MSNDVTQILQQIADGQKRSDELLPLVYRELKELASAKMHRERPDHTLQATDLVHEAYVRLVDVQVARSWDNRGHFFSAAAESMRRILVEHARQKQQLKRGGGFQRITLTEIPAERDGRLVDLIDLDDALRQLEAIDAPAAELFKLRVFAGLSVEEAAKHLEMSRATGFRNWNYSQAWIHAKICGK